MSLTGHRIDVANPWGGRLAVAVVLATVLGLSATACGGGGGASGSDSGLSGQTVSIVDLEPFAVVPSDLPDGFGEKQRQTEDTAASCLRPSDDAEKKLADDIGSLGLIGCQAVTYEHKVASDSDIAGTFALLFKDATGAQGALPLIRDILVRSYKATGDAKVVSVTELPVPALGDQAMPGVLFKVALRDAQTDHSIYLWRRGKVVDVFAAANFLGQLSPDAARDIAAKIDTRAAG
jgi:hypothetical protein